VGAPIGHGVMRLGGNMCCLHEVGKGPKWVLGNVEIARGIPSPNFVVSPNKLLVIEHFQLE